MTNDELSPERDSAIRHSSFVIEVAAGLVFRAGKLLITQRHKDAHLGGLWEFPGGKREANETFEECLARELREELGIEVEVGEVLESITHTYPEKTVSLKFFRCRWKQNEPRAIDCLDLKWVTAEELRNFEFPAADARLLERLQGSPGLWEEPESLTFSEILALVEKEIARVSNPETAALIRSLLVPPRCEERPWDYGGYGEKYPCWIVAEHPASNTGIGYCEKGFGPKCLWGLLWLSGEHLNMGMDSGWFDSLEAAVRDSQAWPDDSEGTKKA